MVQDIPEQDIVMGELELPPQMDPKPEMGAAAAEAAVYDTFPSLLQNPPILAESAQLSAPNIAQLIAMLAAMNANTNRMENNMNAKMEGMNANMEANTSKMDTNTNKLREEMKEMRGEMQQMGHGLQAGIMAFASDEMWTAGGKKWHRHVLGRTSWGGVQRLSGPRWRRVRTG